MSHFVVEQWKEFVPEFEMVKKEVLRNYEYDNQIETNELIYQELKKAYDIQFDIKSKDFDPKFVEFLQKDLNS